jgi:hypothetical protein
MCAKPWLPLERITEENTKQRTQAARMFNTVSRAFKQVYANLGKADSAIFDDSLGDGLRWNLLRESQFGSLEQNIRYDLIRNISPLRRRNCIDAVLREAQAMLDGLSEIQGRLEAKQQEARNRLNALGRFRTQFRDYMLTTPRDGSNPAVDEIRMVSNGHFNPAKYLRALHYCHDFEFNGAVFSAAKLQKLITLQRDELVRQMKDDIRAITTDDFVLALRRNGERRINICKYVHDSFREFALRMLKDNGIMFDQSFPVEEAEAMIRSVVERLQLPGLQDGFFVNVDEVASEVTVSVKKLNDWRNVVWELRKRNADEAKAVFTDYFNSTTEVGPFAEMIEAIGEKIREAVATWMNVTVFNTLRTDFIKGIDMELEQRLNLDQEKMKALIGDCSTVQSMFERCKELSNKLKDF